MTAAARAGKLAPIELPVWRQKYQSDPVGTARVLAGLTGFTWAAREYQGAEQEAQAAAAREPRLAAAAGSADPELRAAAQRVIQAATPAASSPVAAPRPVASGAYPLLPKTRAELVVAGIHPIPAGTPESHPDPGPGRRLHRTEHGDVQYWHIPTRPSALDSRPQVWTGGSEWLGVDEFEKRGMGPVEAQAAWRMSPPQSGGKA